MTDDVRTRLLVAIANGNPWTYEQAIDSILADLSLLIVARPKCERCDGTGIASAAGFTDMTPCLIGDGGCGGTGYVPMVALPAKVVEEWRRVALWAYKHGGISMNSLSPEAVRLAQEDRP